MQCVASDDAARKAEFAQQLLHGRDFVGFPVDLDMGQDQRAIGGERTEDLFCLRVVEGVETSLERLAIERHDACPARGGKVQRLSVRAESGFDMLPFQSLQNVPDRGVGGRPFPAKSEGFVQIGPVDFHEGMDAAIRIGPAHHRQDREQQDMRQLVQLALAAPVIGNVRKQRQQRGEGFSQGGLLR